MKKNKTLKMALINPKGLVGGNNPDFAEFWANSVDPIALRHTVYGFSSGLLTVAALTPDLFEIDIIDEHFEKIDFNKPYDLVGISAITQQADRAYQIADAFREKGVKVAIGGIHATVLPEEAKQHTDSVIIGEAENLWPRFIKDFLEKKTESFYRDTTSVDLTKSPIPRYDLLNQNRYKMVWLQTSRGCPHDCEFCVASRVYGKKYRHKTIEQVIKEVKFVKRVWKGAQLGFSDDNMFLDKNYAKELINRLVPLNIGWVTQTDVSVANDEGFLKLLRKSGCRTFFIGFESISREALQSVNNNRWKLDRLNEYPAIIKKIQSYGIGILGSFIVGFDSDTPAVFDRVANFIIDNHLYGASISILTPLPGSRLRERLEREKKLLSTSWSNHTFFDVNFKPNHMSVSQLQSGLLHIYKQVYNKEANIKRFRYFKEIYSHLSSL